MLKRQPKDVTRCTAGQNYKPSPAGTSGAGLVSMEENQLARLQPKIHWLVFGSDAGHTLLSLYYISCAEVHVV